MGVTHMTSADRDGEAKPDYSLWQIVLFGIVLSLSICFGLYWHRGAHTKYPPYLSSSTNLDVFEPDSTVPVNVSARVETRALVSEVSGRFIAHIEPDRVTVTLSAAKK